jgi:DNA-binding transcriptional LysR family regulator
VQDFLAALHLVADSDTLFTAPAMLLPAADALGLQSCEPPFPVAPLRGHVVWHRRWSDDSGHRWLRDLVFGTEVVE